MTISCMCTFKLSVKSSYINGFSRISTTTSQTIYSGFSVYIGKLFYGRVDIPLWEVLFPRGTLAPPSVPVLPPVEGAEVLLVGAAPTSASAGSGGVAPVPSPRDGVTSGKGGGAASDPVLSGRGQVKTTTFRVLTHQGSWRVCKFGVPVTDFGVDGRSYLLVGFLTGVNRVRAPHPPDLAGIGVTQLRADSEHLVGAKNPEVTRPLGVERVPNEVP
jgi:hypothetical protein